MAYLWCWWEKPLSWIKRSEPAVVRLVFPPHPPPLHLCRLSQSLRRCFPASASGRPGTWVWAQPCCWRRLQRGSDPPQTESAWRRSQWPSPKKTQRRPGTRAPRRGFELRSGCCFQLRTTTDTKVLADVIKPDSRRANSRTDLLDSRNSAVCSGVRKRYAPLECSTWSSKVTELLLLQPARLLDCWWWEKPSVEKLSNSITSVPVWPPIQTQSSRVSTSRSLRNDFPFPQRGQPPCGTRGWPQQHTPTATPIWCLIYIHKYFLGFPTTLTWVLSETEAGVSRAAPGGQQLPSTSQHGRQMWGHTQVWRKKQEWVKTQYLAPETRP